MEAKSSWDPSGKHIVFQNILLVKKTLFANVSGYKHPPPPPYCCKVCSHNVVMLTLQSAQNSTLVGERGRESSFLQIPHQLSQEF